MTDPVTPSANRMFDAVEPDYRLDKAFLELSDAYNLNLRIPVKNRSPTTSRETGDQTEAIYYLFQFAFHNNNVPTDEFHDKALDLCKQWISKPRGERDVTPFVTRMPRANSTAERAELNNLLQQVLLNSKRDFLRESRGTTPIRPVPQEHSGSKRPSGDENQRPNVSKKSKSFPSKRSTGRTHDGRHSRSLYDLSTNTSRETIVFSETGGPVQASQVTQTTVEASTQEKARYPPSARRQPTQESFSISSSSVRALTESFNNYENKNQQLQENVRRLLDSSPTNSYSEFSSRVAEQDMLNSSGEWKDESGLKQSLSLLKLGERLNASWPPLPASLSDAPLAVIWEVLRVLLYCRVDTRDFELGQKLDFLDQNQLWQTLQRHPKLKDKTLPSKSDTTAWNAALDGFYSGNKAVVLTAMLDVSSSNDGPFFEVELQPLKLDATYRLSRRFGPDRFIELIVPSIEKKNIGKLRDLHDDVVAHIRHWIFTSRHPLAGRFWAPFAIRDFRDAKKPASRSEGFEPEPRAISKHRLYLFAEDGNDFCHPIALYSPKLELTTCHTPMTVPQLITWLLEPSSNQHQPVLKLFSRIALGLSRTEPSIVLQQEQIRCIEEDILSPTGKVMNDGIGRISRAFARKVRDHLRLTEIPAGFQGRIGSAKGFWIVDVADMSDDVWIETYPSQRKWNGDLVDDDHRTFEVSSWPKPLESAGLNTQFLPILEERVLRAPAKKELKAYIGKLLVQTLFEEMETQRMALEDPVVCWQWMDRKSTSRRVERLENDRVPMLGGLPFSIEDRIQSLVAAGFEPLQQRFLYDMTYKLCRDKCDELKRRINIKVGRSVYAYMVVDFEDILEEDEIHLGFSTSFKDSTTDFSETFLHGMDVLVARSPAHFVSDIQRVKAVFKPELGSLKDVVVFPIKGAVSLADKLSGGDYDGDMAWICWDQDIVKNFISAPVPETPDLVQEKVLKKRKEKFGDLVKKHGDQAISSFLEEGFDFTMQPNFLGICTVFKESLSYQRKSLSDATAVRLSTLLSNLVDQAKQGIVFTAQDWAHFQRKLLGKKPVPPAPQYKSDSWQSDKNPTHIIDHLKFSVMIPAVDEELERLEKWTSSKSIPAWDKDLVLYFDRFNDLRRAKNKRVTHGMDKLIKALDQFHTRVERLRAREDISFEAKVTHAWDEFHAIGPEAFSGTIKNIITIGNAGGHSHMHTDWDLLKASTYFKLKYQPYSPFMWWIIGSELQDIKSKSAKIGTAFHIIPEIYAALRSDPKYIAARTARRQGLGDAYEDEERKGDGE